MVRDPRVTVAFQYTVREDDMFPIGLFSTDLTDQRPALAEWQAWGGGRRTDRTAARVRLRNPESENRRSFDGELCLRTLSARSRSSSS